jgi:hypothetical protein
LAAIALWGLSAFGLTVGIPALLDTGRAYSSREFPTEHPVSTIGLGSSHALDFYYPVLDPRGFSLHQDMSDLKTAEYNLRMALAEAPSIKLVLLAYSPGMLNYDFELAGGDPSFRNRWLVDAPFVPSVMNAGELGDRLFAEAEQLGSGGRLVVDRIATMLPGRTGDAAVSRCRPRQKTGQGYHFGILNGYPVAPAPAECLPFDYTGRQHASKIWASLRADPSLPKQNETRVAAMAAQIRADGGYLVLVTPPYTRYYSNSPEMRAIWALHDDQTRALVARTGVTYLDFRDFFPPSMYERNNRIFRDNTHLTSTGAALFSRALRTKLEHLGLLPG